MAADVTSANLGIRLIHAAPGKATVTMKVTDGMLNGHGMTHGGLVFTLADTAFAVACNGYGRTTVAAGASITFMTPTRAGDELTAVATERVRRGRSGVYDVTVRCGADIVAEFRGNSREIGD